MELFGTLLSLVLDLFRTEFMLYGFTFSFWQVFIFDIVVGIIALIIVEVFFG